MLIAYHPSEPPAEVKAVYTPTLKELFGWRHQVAKESADVVILDDNFSTVVTVAKWGRSVYTNIQKFVQFQLTVNIVALILNFSSACLTGKCFLLVPKILRNDLNLITATFTEF